MDSKTDSSFDNRSLTGEWYDPGAAVDAADWVETASSTAFSIDLGSLTVGAYNDITLSSPSTVSKTGRTGLRLHISGGEPTFINEALINKGANPPKLSVTYPVSLTDAEAGTVAPTGALSALATLHDTMAGTAASSGNVTDARIIVPTSGSVSPTGDLTAKIRVNLSGTVNISGALSVGSPGVPFTAGLDYDITLAEYGFQIDVGTLVRSDITASIPRIAIATESKKRSDFSELDTLGQFTWQHGQGQYLFSDPAAYLETDFCDTRIPGQVIPSPDRHVTQKQGGGNFSGEAVDMVYWPATGKLYVLVKGTVAANNRLYEWDNVNSEWDPVTGADALLQAADSVPYRMWVHAVPDALPARTATAYLVISRGTPGNTTGLDYIYSSNGTTFTAAPGTGNGSKAVHFAHFKERLVFDPSSSAIVLRPNPSLSSTSTDTLINNLGNPAEPITNIMTYGELLLIFKTSGAHAVFLNADGLTYSSKPVLDYAWGRDSENGKAAIVKDGLFYFNVLQYTYQYNGTSIRSVGPDLGAHEAAIAVADINGIIQVPRPDASGQSPKEDKRGTFKRLTADGNWVYGSVEPYTGTTRTLLAYGGTGWHEMTQPGTGAVGLISYQPKLATTGALQHPTLWYRDGDSISYLRLSLGTDNRWEYSQVDYETVGVRRLTTAWFDADLPEVWKDWLWLYLKLEIKDSTASVTVELQVDGDTVWHTLGTSYGLEPLRFPDNSNRFGHLRAQKIRLRLTLTGGVKLTSYFFRFISRPEPRWGWKIQLAAQDMLDLVNRTLSPVTAKQFERRLWRLRQRSGPLRFDDGLSPSGLKNHVLNPGFEGWDTALTVPLRWLKMGGAGTTLSRNSQYKYQGGYSCKVVTTGIDGGISIENDIVVPAGTYHTVVRIYNPTNTDITVRMTRNGTIVGEVKIPRTVGLSDWDGSGTEMFQRVVIPFQVLSTASLNLFIFSPAAGATFYVDAVEIRDGPDDESEYIAEGEPRCRPTTLGSYFNTTSYRQPWWLVYISGISGARVVPVQELDELGNPRVGYETRFLIELREASF